MNTQTKRRRRHGKKLAEPVFTRRRVLARKGTAICLMDIMARRKELDAASPKAGQIAYLRQVALAADHHMIRAQDMIDVIALAVTNPEFGKARGDGKGTIGGDTIANQLAVVIEEIEAIRGMLFTKEVLSYVAYQYVPLGR